MGRAPSFACLFSNARIKKPDFCTVGWGVKKMIFDF